MRLVDRPWAAADDPASTVVGIADYRAGPITERLILRAYEPRDADAFFRLNCHPDVVRFTGEPPLASVTAARAAIQNYPDWDRHGIGRWACVLRSNGDDSEPIGFCGLKYLDDRAEVDVGYRFLPEHWGRGLATEAGRATLEFGFATIGLESICALVMPGNTRSIRVLVKLGLARVDDVVFDDLEVQRWVATRDDWQRRRGAADSPASPADAEGLVASKPSSCRAR